MKKYLFLAFQLFSLTLASQVTTRIVQDNSFRNHVEKHAPGDVIEHDLPKPNVEQTLIEDAMEGRQLQRFAIKIPANFTKNDGIFFETNTTINWKLAILSESATSLNFQFKDIHFPEGAEMDSERYSDQDKKTIKIFNQLGNMVYLKVIETNILDIDVSALVSGSYYLNVIDSKSSFSKNFIKL